jgi:hypothetical protein
VSIAESDPKKEFLKNIYFFNSMPDSALEKIESIGIEKNYERGAVVFF